MLIWTAGEQAKYMSLLKVFKALISLYKRNSLHVKEYDKNMLALYTSYVRAVIEDTFDKSYVSACEILEHLDHFNCVDKIVAKV